MLTAFVFINTVPKFMPQVLEEIRKMEGVEEAEMVYGNYDIVAKVKTETMDKLKKTVSSYIRTTNKVLATQTTIVVRQE
jgi:DNA-binding Lrp family transcriptional regulator